MTPVCAFCGAEHSDNIATPCCDAAKRCREREIKMTTPKQPAPGDAPSRPDKCAICAHLEDGFCNAGIDCVGGSAFTPKPAPSDGQDANSHPVLFADDFLSTAMQKLDFLMERGSRCVAIILQNRYGYQQKIDRWGKVVIVEAQPAAQDVMGVLEDDALALRISLHCHFDNNDPLLNAINAYRAAVRERVNNPHKEG